MRESNIEFAEGHTYQQYSATQIQPNDIRLNLGCRQCHSPRWQLFLLFSFSHPDFLQRDGIFWLGQLLNFTRGRCMKYEVALYRDRVCEGFTNCWPGQHSCCFWNGGTSSCTVFSFFPADLYSCSKVTTVSYFNKRKGGYFSFFYWASVSFFQIYEKTLCLLNTIPLN